MTLCRALALLGLLAAAPAVLSVEVEEGKPAELRGTRTIAIVTPLEATREALLEELKATIPELRLVEDPREADIIMIVNASTEVVAVAPPVSSGCEPCQQREKEEAGKAERYVLVASVVRPLSTERVRRLLLFRASGPQERVLIRRAVSDLARAWRKSNDSQRRR